MVHLTDTMMHVPYVVMWLCHAQQIFYSYPYILSCGHACGYFSCIYIGNFIFEFSQLF